MWQKHLHFHWSKAPEFASQTRDGGLPPRHSILVVGQGGRRTMVTFDLGEGPVPGGRPAGPSRSGSRSQHRSSARRAPRKANTRRNAAPDWGDLAGLTFEETVQVIRSEGRPLRLQLRVCKEPPPGFYIYDSDDY